MNVLLDTNIIIHREANKIINQDIGVLFHWLDKLHYRKCIHPLTVEELNRNVNAETAKTMQLKIANYTILRTPAPLNDAVQRVAGKIDVVPNDANDTSLLNEVYCNRVAVLVSEDKKIHRKARLLGIGDRVFRIETFLEKLVSENPDFVDYSILAVKKEFFGNVKLEDEFFDTFRNAYVGFDKWYNKKAGENTQAYVCYEGDVLQAFLFLKLETEDEGYADISPTFTSKRRLKIGTFKVISNGLRIGERFLKIVFDNARQYKVDEIYVTIFDDRPELLSLIALLENFGFIYHGTKTGGSGVEKVYVRNFDKGEASLQHPKLTFPWLSKQARVFIVPIRPEYHTELFPDSILRTESRNDFVENVPHRNAISKSYISHSPNRDLRPGDILVFYRSGGIYLGVSTTICIVESIIDNLKSLDELIGACKKRTVLKAEDLEKYWNFNPKRRPFVINMLYAFSFKKRITLKEMLDQKILPSMDAVRTINQMSWESFVQLIHLAKP